jgi:hypothetical protein
MQKFFIREKNKATGFTKKALFTSSFSGWNKLSHVIVIFSQVLLKSDYLDLLEKI